MKLSVIIPVYNEVKNIEEILKRVKATALAWEIVVVDDDSTDGTHDLLQKLDDKGGLRVILHDRNQGKGAAVVPDFKRHTATVLLIQDADLEYSPHDYPVLLPAQLTRQQAAKPKAGCATGVAKMCLAIPVQVTELLDGDMARVTLDGVTKIVSLALVEDVRPGDYVILHSGMRSTSLTQTRRPRLWPCWPRLERPHEICR